MDTEVDNSKSTTTDSEDDDIGCYFLQPSASPYNITEKIQQANLDLFTSSPSPNNKENNAKVKFKKDLVSFEPDLTDDDVNSIESDNIDQESQHVEYKTTIVNNDTNIYDIEEVEEKVEEEEVIEEIHSDFDFAVQDSEQNLKNAPIEQQESNISDTLRQYSCNSSSRKKRRSKIRLNEVHCKNHCIDKLDFDLSMSIKKLDIHEKVSLPPLPLIQRKCCDEIKQKLQKNLPTYNGLRSEYGLTSRQLERRMRQKEQLEQKEELRRKLHEEYRLRKIQQNEEVFCQWLKEVSRRKTEKQNIKKPHSHKQMSLSPKILTLPVKHQYRPNTANEFIPKTSIKKKRRPHSTNSCVYIQVPRVLLERGVTIGDMVIKNAENFSKKLHIVTFS